MLTSDQHTGVDQLIVTGGAVLDVADPDGTCVYHRPLARMWRLDTSDPTILWIRPIDGRRHQPGHGIVFSLSLMRPRSLRFDLVTIDTATVTSTVTMALWNGQTAYLRAATGIDRDELEEFDHFITHTAPNTSRELHALNEDSWSGEWA